MPRITRKDKEAGKAPKKEYTKPSSTTRGGGAPHGRGGGRGGSSRGGGRGGFASRSDRPPRGDGAPSARGGGSSRGGGRGGFKKTSSSAPTRGAGGFKVGPTHAPRDAYLGKARKIKAELIEKAKIKKQYAKVLQKEGLSSGRLGDGSKRRSEFVKGAAPKTAHNDDDGEGASGDEDEGEGGSDDETDYDSDNSSILGAEGAAFAKAMRAAARGEKGEKGADRAETGDDRRRDRAGPAPGDNSKPERRGDFKGKGRDREQRGERGDRRGGFTRDRAPHVAPSASAASAPGVLPVEPAVAAKDGSLRDLKKAAFGKYARAPNAKGNANVGGRKGQPNMGARMDMLLEKIRRNK